MTTLYTAIPHLPNDTVSDDDVWVMMRRVHFYVGDIVSRALHQRLVSTTQRRILDAVDYAHISNLEAVPISTLCAMIPILLKPQTAASAMGSLRERGLVKSRQPEPKEARTWHLTDEGLQTRANYGHETEQILTRAYGPESDRLTSVFLARALLAFRDMNDRLMPVLEYEGGLATRRPDEPSSPWVALRRVHFYIDDLICREIEPFGVGKAERRVLDSLGYAKKHGVDCGLNVGTICRLNIAVTRPVVQSALSRMADLLWVERIVGKPKKPGARAKVRWQLTKKGVEIRLAYKRYAQLMLRQVIDLDEACGAELLALAKRAHTQRDSRYKPAIENYLRRRE